ncbi:MAG: hypothetical protein H7Z37_11620 [Pyrinomonadaceae bacterium]|nr:hypothetical protein [Pyrinomonadaceae bacterium]
MSVLKTSSFWLIITVLVTGGFLFGILFSDKMETQKAVAARSAKWQYCSMSQPYAPQAQLDRIDRFIGTVEVIYFQQYRNKNEVEKFIHREIITSELSYGEFLQENGMAENFQSRQAASLRASELAFAKALGKLGNDGWEIVGDSFKNFNFTNAQVETHLKSSVYFKRPVN